MVASEAQKRATAKWSAVPENKVKIYNNTARYRENDYAKHLELHRSYRMKCYAKQRGYMCYDDYLFDVTLRCIYKLFN